MTAEFSDQSMSQTFSVASPGRLARKSSMGFNTTMLDEHLSARPKSREQLTPMPTYMEPITKSAGRCWAKLHEDHMLLKLRKRKTLKSEQNHKIRDDAIRSVKRLPTEVLVMDWMKEQLQTLEPRVFLIENLLPTLILGLEKLLVEVEKRDVGELTTLDFRFNPINFLAQYLMRNNPRYSNFSEASPYIHGLRLISEEMKKQLFDYDSNSLSVMKIQARRRRKQREAQRSQLHAEKKRRMMALINQYEEWSEGLLTGGHIDLALIQNTLRSFFEITEQYPQELRQVTSKMAELLEPTDDTDTSLSVREYTSYMKKFIIDIPSEIFDHLLTHLSQCAREYKVKVEREHRRTKLAQLFSFCDHTGVGLVDRHRILNLFEIFYDKAKDDIRNALRNPRKWPVLEVTEVDSEDGGPDEEEQDPKFFDNNRDVTEETKESNPGNLVEVSAPDEENVEEKDLPNGDDPVVLRTHAVKALPASEGEGAVDGEKGEVEKGKAEGKTAEESKTDSEPKETDAAEKTEKEQEDVEARKEEVKTGEVKEGEVKEGEVKTEEVKEGEVKEEEVKEEEVKEEEVKADEVKEGEVKEEEVEKEEVTEEEKKEEEKKEGEKKEEEKPSVEEANSQEAHQPEVKPTEDVKVILTPEGADEEQAAETEEGKAVSGSDEKPPLTQQSRVSFAEGTTFEKGERALLTSHGSRSQSQASAFDENTLNESQFVQLTETFLCDDPDYEEMFTKLVGFVKDGYMETEEERMKRLIKARQDLKSAKQKALLNSLFEMWDNDGSGVLDIEEIEATMKKYKDGMEVEAITKARKEIKKKIKLHQDSRINKREFRELVFRVISMMPGMDEFDYFVDFLLSNVERSYAERVRGEARKKWLQQIVNAAEMSAARMEPVYKILFKALFKDAEAHGGSKVISGYIALLEKNDVAPKRGGFMLRYVASTPSDAVYLLGRALFPDMKGISFACVEAAKPIHVPKVANHGNIHFWNIDRIAEERNGSFIVIPMKDRNKRVFGILGIDTMNDPHSRALFITHEIQFFQGVAKAFSIAYHHVDVRQKTMRISESAISWIRRRSPHVIQVTVYMVEPDGRNQDFVLRKMMDTNLRGVAAPQKNPPRLERKDNLFRDYLFKCVDNSETISADAYGERHLAVPLRDYDGWAIVVVDISIIDVKELPHIESREVMKMLKLLQMAYKEIFREAIEGEKKYMLEGERESDNNRTGIMFDRLMLMELRDNVSKLDATAYAELKSYKEPPEVVHLILKSVLAIFHHKLAVEGYFDNWNQCKQYVKPQLNQMIINYDPTAVEPIKDPVPLELINSYLDDVPHGTVAKHGSMPAQFLYNWVFVCVSLIEHSRKMRAGRPRVITEEIAARKRTKVLEGMASADVEDAKEEEEEEKKGDDKEAESEGEGEDESKQKSEEGSLKDNAKDDHPSLESGKNKDVKKSPSGGAKESTSGESNEDSSDNSESDEGSESDEIDDSD